MIRPAIPKQKHLDVVAVESCSSAEQPEPHRRIFSEPFKRLATEAVPVNLSQAL